MLHAPSKLVSAFEAGIAKTIAARVAPAKMSFRVEGRNIDYLALEWRRSCRIAKPSSNISIFTNWNELSS